MGENADILLKIGFSKSDTDKFSKSFTAAFKSASESMGKDLNKIIDDVLKNISSGKLKNINFTKDLRDIVVQAQNMNLNDPKDITAFVNKWTDLFDNMQSLSTVFKNIDENFISELSSNDLNSILNKINKINQERNNGLNIQDVIQSSDQKYKINYSALTKKYQGKSAYKNIVTDDNIQLIKGGTNAKNKAEEYLKLRGYYESILAEFPVRKNTDNTYSIDFDQLTGKDTEFNNLNDSAYKNLVNKFQDISDAIPKLIKIGNEIAKVEKEIDPNILETFGSENILNFKGNGGDIVTSLQKQASSFLIGYIQNQVKKYEKYIKKVPKEILDEIEAKEREREHNKEKEMEL